MSGNSMTLSARTIQLLKNFAQINQSLVFQPGHQIATYSQGRTIFAKATIEEDFGSQFAIYDLNKFLSVLSLFDEPNLVIGENMVTISSGAKKVNYMFADLSLFQGRDKPDPYKIDKNTLMPSVELTFDLTEATLADIKKAVSVLRLPEMAVIGDGSTVAIEVMDSKNPSADVYAIELGEADKNFRFIFREENLRVIPGDYTVDVHWGNRKLAHFLSNDVHYLIAVENNSSYQG